MAQLISERKNDLYRSTLPYCQPLLEFSKQSAMAVVDWRQRPKKKIHQIVVRDVDMTDSIAQPLQSNK